MSVLVRSLFIGSCFVFAVTPAWAEEVVFGLNQSLRYDSNVFRVERNPLSSLSYNVEPSLRVRRENEKFHYRVIYTPSFEVYTDTDRLDGWEHLGSAFASYQFNEAANLSFTGSATRQKINGAASRGESESGSSLLRSGLGFVDSYQVNLRSQYYFTPRVLGDLSLAYSRRQYTNNSGVDSRSGRGELRLDYQWTPGLAVGLGGTASYSSFERLLTRSPSQTATFNANAIARFRIDSRTELALSGGPAFIRNHQAVAGQSLTVPKYAVRVDSGSGALRAAVFDSSCPLVDAQPALFGCSTFADAAPLGADVLSSKTVFYDPGKEPVTSSQSLLTFFTEAKLTRTLAKTTLSLSYARREDSSAGDGRTTIRDSVDLRVDRRFSRTWTLGIDAAWQEYSSTAPLVQSVVRAGISGVPISPGGPLFFAEADGLTAISFASDYRSTLYRVVSHATRRVSKNVTVRAVFYFIDQDTTQSLTVGVTTQRTYLATLSLRYEFDPIKF